MDEEGRTALGAARARFMDSLGQRAQELGQLLDAVVAAPVDAAARERLRRRVHALYASAQVFQDEGLASSIKAVVECLDRARDAGRELSTEDLGVVRALVAELGGEPAPASEPLQRPSATPDDQISSVFRLDALSEPEPLRAPEPPGPAGRADQPIMLTRTISGGLQAPEVLACMLVSGPELAATLRAVLPLERCELTTSSDPDTAAEVLDNVAPDVVLLDAQIARSRGRELVERLRGVRTGIVKAVVLVGEGSDGDALAASAGADAWLQLPMDGARLLSRLHHLAGASESYRSHLASLEGGTVDEIAQSVAEEVRRGIAESLRGGKGERIELEDKAEIMAATWSAIGRIRAHLAERTEGRVSFSERPYAGGPAELALTDDLPAAPYVGVGDALRGRHVLVADDDPAVLWFFGGLLREAGAIVHEAEDGKQALEMARRRVPDVVISDILMPEVDGFALCRELERDHSLAHVPVILLSWKEDFLQRMRELDSGAAGYLRKEAGSHQILATVAGVLGPRVELEALLSAGDEVHGRVDSVGMRRLIETVAAKRGSARITVRDAWNLFEIDVRDRNRIAVTRTASDGHFARGPVALRQLLAVDVGRFTVSSVDTPVRGVFDVPLDQALAEAERRLGAVVDAVSDRWLVRVARVELDDDVLATLLTATPTVLAEVVACLRQERPVSDLLVHGSFPARELEQHLRELARRGGITGVIGHRGEDLIAEAERERLEHPGALRHSSERPVPESLPPTTLADSDVEWLEGEPQASTAVLAQPIEITGESAVAALEVPAAAPVPVEAVEVVEVVEAVEVVDVQELQDVQEAPSRQVSALPPPMPVGTADAPAPSASVAPRSAGRAPSSSPGVEVAQGFAVRSSLLTEPPPSMPAPPEEQRSPLVFLLTLVALGIVGYLGARAFLFDTGNGAGGDGYPVAAPQGAPEATAGPRPQPGAGLAQGPALPAPSRPPAAAPTFGRVLPFIDHSRGVEVGDDQGLLVIEYDGNGSGPQLRVGKLELGPAPAGVALEGGRHELVIERDGRTSFRFLTIRPGETRIVEVQ